MNVIQGWRKALVEWRRLSRLRQTAHASTAPAFRRVNVVLKNSHRRTLVLHLLRAILRECTYLPDLQARNYMRQYCMYRFEANKGDVDQLSKTNDLKSANQRTRRQIIAAKDALKYLQRVNAGHKRHMNRILGMTYGRIGKRRHQLLAPFKEESPSTGPEYDINELSPELSALLRSQPSRPGGDAIRIKVKRLSPQIPETNAWGRPMPLKRVRNMKRRFYGNVLERTLPPVPQDEWKRLRRLALGQELAAPLPVKRRGGSVNDVGWKAHYLSTGKSSRPHFLTKRFMRRRFAQILLSTPVMEKRENASKGGLEAKVVWADIRKEGEVTITPGRRLPLAMFEGVDEKGRLLGERDKEGQLKRRERSVEKQ